MTLESAIAENQKNDVEKRYTTLTNQKAKVLEAFEQGIYSKELMQERLQVLEGQINIVRVSLSEITELEANTDFNIHKAFDLLNHFIKLFFELEPASRLTISNILFPNGLILKNGVLEPYGKTSIFYYIKELNTPTIKDGAPSLSILELITTELKKLFSGLSAIPKFQIQ